MEKKNMNNAVSVNFDENETLSEAIPEGHIAAELELESGKEGNLKGKGGWKTCPYIFGNEICEKVGAIGIQVNMITYLVQQMHMKTAKAATTINNFSGTVALGPLLGAYVADTYLGRYYTIILASIFYTMGGLILTSQSLFHSLKPPPCTTIGKCEAATSTQFSFLYLGFFFLAMGSAGIRPCVAPFGADQFDEKDPKHKKQLESFFNWYYFGLVFSILLTVTVLVYVQDNVGWSWGFGVPSICMFLSLVVFVIGTPLYRQKPPLGSPFVQLAYVIVAAIRKRNLELPSDSKMLYEQSITEGVKLAHTNRFRFLDKAAIITEPELNVMETSQPSRWQLCTIQEVEQLKTIIKVIPIFSTGIIFFAANAQHGTFWVQQARTLDRRIGHRFLIPPGSMGFFNNITMLLWIPIYDRIIQPFVKSTTGRAITFLQRIGIGFIISITVMMAAAFTETKRQAVARNAGLLDHPHTTIPISVFLLIPQYMLAGLAEAFVSIGFLEFLYDQIPERMRNMAIAIHWTMISMGSYFSSFLVFVIGKATTRLHGNWVDDNLNRGHLDYFYWLFASLLTLNFLTFQAFGRWYAYQGKINTSQDCERPKMEKGTRLRRIV